MKNKNNFQNKKSRKPFLPGPISSLPNPPPKFWWNIILKKYYIFQSFSVISKIFRDPRTKKGPRANNLELLSWKSLNIGLISKINSYFSLNCILKAVFGTSAFSSGLFKNRIRSCHFRHIENHFRRFDFLWIIRWLIDFPRGLFQNHYDFNIISHVYRE